MGDLSGGQIIRRGVARAYDLSLEDGLGMRSYEFDKLDSSGSSTPTDIRIIKDWYRSGMDEGAGNDRQLKAMIVDEANHVFELHGAALAALDLAPIRQPSQFPLASPSSTTHFLGEPESSSASTSSSPTTMEPEKTVLRIGESKVLTNAFNNANDRKSLSFPIHIIVPFVVAFGIARFMVVKGFGEDKWRLFMEYMWNSLCLGASNTYESIIPVK